MAQRKDVNTQVVLTERERLYYRVSYHYWLAGRGWRRLFFLSLLGNVVQWIGSMWGKWV